MVLCFQCLELTKPKDSLNTTSETVRIEDPKHWSWQGILKCLVCRPPRRGNSYTGPGSGWRHCRELTSSGFRVIAGNHDSHADRVSRDWVWPDQNESSIAKDIVAAYNRSQHSRSAQIHSEPVGSTQIHSGTAYDHPEWKSYHQRHRSGLQSQLIYRGAIGSTWIHLDPLRIHST